jgi:hypothetical protein
MLCYVMLLGRHRATLAHKHTTSHNAVAIE